MRKALGTLIVGFAGGWLLSRLRAMPGGDLFDWPLVSAGAAAAWREVALVLIAVCLWNNRNGLRWSLLASITLGYAVTGLFAGPRQGFPWIGLVVATIVVAIAAPWTRSKETPLSSQDGAHPANVGEMAGLFVAGAGVAVALESVARHVRMFGSGLAQDDTVFGSTLLVFVTLGAASFGWMSSGPRTRRLSFPVLLAATAATCFVSLGLLETISDPQGLTSFVRRWGLRSVDHGTLAWDPLVGAASFVLPGLFLGAALAGARGRSALSSAVFGAAVGFVALPRMLDRGFGAQSSEAEIFTAQFIPLATMAAAAGAALAILSESRRRPVARWAALLLLLPCALVPLVRNAKPIFVLNPWSERPIMPFLAFDSPGGLVTVEPAGSEKVATLARVLLTPAREDAGADAQRMRDSFALLPAARRAEGSIRVLLVGQLSVLRAYELKTLGATRIDRSAAWWKAMPRLEQELFKRNDGTERMQIPDGEVLSPKEARARLSDGQYDLVIAPPVEGDAPAIARVDVPAQTVVVRWLGLDQPLRNVSPHEPAVLSADGLDSPSLGIVTHGSDPLAEKAQRPRAIDASQWDMFVPSPLAWSLTREMNRTDKARAAAFRSLAASWKPSSTPFIRGLAAHYAAQVPSSPFENVLQSVEMSDTALEQLALDAHGGLDTFTRPMWEWIARVLVGKRDMDKIEKWIGPLAAAHATWPALEVSLAYADLEGLEATKAVERLEPVVARGDADWRAWFALGEAREIAGNAAGAAAAFKKADELLPDQLAIRRRYAMAACRAGDPDGRRVAQELVIADPKDTEMQAYLEPGPPPPAPKAYQPRD